MSLCDETCGRVLCRCTVVVPEVNKLPVLGEFDVTLRAAHMICYYIDVDACQHVWSDKRAHVSNDINHANNVRRVWLLGGLDGGINR